MGLCCLQFSFPLFQAKAPGLPWRFIKVFVTWQASGKGRSLVPKPLSEICPSNWFQKEHLTWQANEATRAMCWVRGAALFPWIRSLKGVTGALAAIVYPKERDFLIEPTERTVVLSEIWTARDHSVRTQFGLICAAVSKASIFLDISHKGVS